jgi:predicted Zn-dependent peptidase
LNRSAVNVAAWTSIAALATISVSGASLADTMTTGNDAAAVASVSSDVMAPVTTTLPSGLRIICRYEKNTPLVAINVMVQAGQDQETTANAGIASFVARTLLTSTSSNTPDQETTDINAIGGNVNAVRQPDWLQITALTVPDKFADAASLVTNSLKDADFQPDIIASTKSDIASDIDGTDADLFQTAYQKIRQTFYGASLYGLPASGTQQSIRSLTRSQLLDYYKKNFVPSHFTIVVDGDVSPEVAVDTISSDLDPFPMEGRGTKSDSSPRVLALPASDFTPVHEYQADLQEVVSMVGYQAAPMTSPDYPALLVANAILGGMKSSRLFTDVRETRGLAYELGTFYNPQLSAGDIVGYVFAAPQQPAPDAKDTTPITQVLSDAIIKQFELLKTTPPTAAELTRAQHYLIGSYLIKHETIQDRANLLGTAAIATSAGADFDTNYAKYINAVTAADVQRVATKYFNHPAVCTIEPDTSPNTVVKD